MDMKQAGELYRLLGDEVRLRLLRVLAGKHGRLNVTELTSVLGIAQSGVSRHLRLLKEAGLSSKNAGAVSPSIASPPPCSMAGSAASGRRSRPNLPGRRTRRRFVATRPGCRK